jgi:D-alanyl-D-alanine dipeptidase
MATAKPADFERIGYKNGRIPECALSPVKGTDGAKLHPQAAEQMGELLLAAKRAGVTFTISSSYRPLADQFKVKTVQGRGAATPGTSMHGWGTTIDIAELYNAAVNTAIQMNRTLPANQKVDRFSAAVHAKIRNENALYRWLDANASKYGWVNPEWARNGGSVDECWHWEYQAWPTLPTGARRSTVSSVTARCGQDTPLPTPPTRTPRGSKPKDTGNITPFIGSLESFHPRIQYELTRRRIASETANTYMPFFKLTSLVNILRDNLQGATQEQAEVMFGDNLDKDKFYAWCPSLGVHGENTVSFDDIYIPQDNRSVVAYATANINTSSEEIKYGRIPIVVQDSNSDQRNIPIPGILEVNLDKGTAGPMGVRGGLLKADIKIVAYSVGQVDTLLRYFLRPATRVVMEFGRKSSNPKESPIVTYDWGKPADTISQEFTDLILDPEKQQKFIKDYIYASNGNYEVYLGYVVKFDLKYNKNNVYEIGLTIHSVQQFELPTRHTGVKSLCADSVSKCSAMDVQEYFAEEYAWKQKTFSKLMADVSRKSIDDPTYEWHDDFIEIRNSQSNSQGAGSQEAGLSENEYFVSWKFFVQKILGDTQLGILSIMPDEATKNIAKLGLLRPTREITQEDINMGKVDNELIANQVGYHPDLRSIDPNVMVIYNPTAQSRRSSSEQNNYQNLIDAAITDESQRNVFRNNNVIEGFITGENGPNGVGEFKNITEPGRPGASYLTNGVWLNTKAIKQAFTTTDTISSAINSLLMMMNAATEGYWNLQLYSSERPVAGLYVVDMGLSKKLTALRKPVINNQLPWIDNEENESTNVLSSVTGVNITRYQSSTEKPDKPAYIYMFNRGTKRFNDGELGSDLIDLNVEFNLPQVIAVQAIAGVGGPAQKSTLQSIDIPQLNKITLIKNLFATCSPQNICAQEECNDQDLINLKNEWDAIRINNINNQSPLVVGSTEYDFGTAEATGGSVLVPLRRDRSEEDKAKQKYNAAQIQRTYGNSLVINTVQELSSLGTTLNLIEFNPGSMMKKLNIDSTTADALGSSYATPNAHAFNSSNLTKTVVNITLPGIGGINLFQSFLVDRVPSILQRGFYVVTKLTHKFSSSNGWTTSIEGRFRFRPDRENSGTGQPCGGLDSPNVQASGGGTRGFAQGLYGAR